MTRDAEPFFDLVRIVSVLAEHAVMYVLIGGVSGTLHGMTDYQTKDVDLFVRRTAYSSTGSLEDPFAFDIEDGADD